MAKETIKAIEKAEKKAQDIIKNAENEGKAIIQKAKDDSDARAINVIGAARAQANSDLEKVEETQGAAMLGAAQRAECVINQMKEAAASKKEEAIKAVISEIA